MHDRAPAALLMMQESAFKIEGRMKGAYYVAAVVKAYRNQIINIS